MTQIRDTESENVIDLRERTASFRQGRRGADPLPSKPQGPPDGTRSVPPRKQRVLQEAVARKLAQKRRS